MPWRKPTWVPSGASGLPAVKPLPLPATPAEPVSDQGGPAGSYAKLSKLPVPTDAAGVTTILAVVVSDRPEYGTLIDDRQRPPIVEDKGGAGMTVRAGVPQRR